MSILPPSDLLTLRHDANLVTNIEDKMDDMKAAAGLSTSTTTTGTSSSDSQSGQEPLSGEQGKGTVGEPFDAGNQAGELSGLGFFISFFRCVLLGESSC